MAKSPFRLTALGAAIAGVLGVGNTSPAASGAGVSFPATQSASTDVNTLDDYEEGSFTPVIAGDATSGVGTYSTQVGRYTKIGNRVFFSINISWSAHTGTGNIKITGLPFTSENTAGLAHAVVATYVQNLALSANNILTPYIGANEAVIWLNQSPIGAGGVVTQVPMDAAAMFGLSGSYSV